ncbi:MAG TPA: STAS domain-containing protein [Acidimicrobiales bacterium]|nr:STAS domain-containing protein [Acidimicrobiales bacterium]
MDEVFEVTVERRGDVPVVMARGEVDVSTAPALRTELLSVGDGAPFVVVDLSGVTFLDSTGLGALIAARGQPGESDGLRELRLVVTRPQIRKVLEVTGLTSVFAVHDTLDAALAT